MLGVKVGSYEITQKLASGGMGAVYLAHHDIMDRDAVVKVLHPRFSHDKSMVSRFFNEARAADSIKHPGIVEIYDVGYAGERAFIVMECLKGEDLAARLRSRRMPMANALSMVRQVASALSAAHARGIVHRDLKPENIFVEIDRKVPGGERIKLLDFGIAKLAEPRDGVMTAQGSLFGTPAYMSPEQCSDAATVDHRADLYALGCVLYQLLSGQPPFGKGGIELLAAHLRDTPTPVSERDPSIPDELGELTMRLLEKNPDDRYPSCLTLIEALDKLDVATFPPAPDPGEGQAWSMAPTVPPSSNTGQSSLNDVSLDDTLMTSSSTEPMEALDASMSPTIPSAELTEPLPEPSERPESTPLDQPDTKTEGELSNTSVTTHERRGRYWIAAVALFAVAGIAVALVMWSRGGPSQSQPTSSQVAADAAPVAPTPPEQPAWHEQLETARKAVADNQWTRAIAAASNVLGQENEHAEAKALVAQAEREIANKSTYEQFTATPDDAPVAAMAAYRRIPEDSVYRDQAAERYQQVRDAWIQARLAKARRHRDVGKCKAIAPIRKKIAKQGDEQPFQDALAQVDEVKAACKTRASSQPNKPRPFNIKKAEKRLEAMSGAFAGCAKLSGKTDRLTRVLVSVAPDGRAYLGAFGVPGREARKCVRDIIKTLRFAPSDKGGNASTLVRY